MVADALRMALEAFFAAVLVVWCCVGVWVVARSLHGFIRTATQFFRARARRRLMPWGESPQRLECAWCGSVLREGAEPVSHGICGPCRKAHFPDATPGTLCVDAVNVPVPLEETGYWSNERCAELRAMGHRVVLVPRVRAGRAVK